MLNRYWKFRGGTLIEEFKMVEGRGGSKHRCADGVILPNVSQITLQGKSRKRWHYLKDATTKGQQKIRNKLRGQEVVVVQVKPARLGICLMGQATFSRWLIDNEEFQPDSVDTIAICGASDPVLEPLLKSYCIRVRIDDAPLRSGEPPTGSEREKYAGLNPTLVQRYWNQRWNRKGVVIYDFPLRCSYTAHGLIFPNLEGSSFGAKRELYFDSLDQTGKEKVRRLLRARRQAIMVTTRRKGIRPGMCTMGHALFAPKLLKLDYPSANIRSVIACTRSDNALKGLLNLESFRQIEMVEV